jgi:hypothetical protein
MTYKRPVIEHPVFGRLEYFSAYWLGEMTLEQFCEPFKLIIRARKQEPTAAQCAAMQGLRATMDDCLAQAALAMTELHRQSLAMIGGGNMPDDIWSALAPMEIEVCAADYAGDGRSWIILVFQSRLIEGLAPAIATADGVFTEVLSGT